MWDRPGFLEKHIRWCVAHTCVRAKSLIFLFWVWCHVAILSELQLFFWEGGGGVDYSSVIGMGWSHCIAVKFASSNDCGKQAGRCKVWVNSVPDGVKQPLIPTAGASSMGH